LKTEKVIDFIQEFDSINRKIIVNRVFIFSDIAALRLNYQEQRDFLHLIQDSNKGRAVFLPAFTYNSRHSKPYNKYEIPSKQNGSLTRVAFAENLHMENRSLDEDYSYLILNSDKLTDSELNDLNIWREKSFGENSHHTSLLKNDALVYCIGKGFTSGFSLAMHIEALIGVPYRSFIELPSQVVEGNSKKYFSKQMEAIPYNISIDRETATDMLRSANTSLFAEKDFGNEFKVYVFLWSLYQEVVSKSLVLDPHFFCRSLEP
jgi:hypothetical protein